METYKNQIKLLERQREEVQAKLSDAEDARIRSEASLTNLQVVLEQFQLGMLFYLILSLQNESNDTSLKFYLVINL